MFCGICLSKRSLCDKQSKFVKDGWYKISTLKRRKRRTQKCAAHPNVVTATPNTNPAEKALQALNQENFNEMRIIFRISHFIAKKGRRPFSDNAWRSSRNNAWHLTLPAPILITKPAGLLSDLAAETEHFLMADDLKNVPFYRD